MWVDAGTSRFDDSVICSNTSDMAFVVDDDSKGLKYSSTVDGLEYRGYGGHIWMTGTNGATERLRLLYGGGLTFNGDTAAANALDDYEEGTFTPVLTGTTSASGVTYDTQTGIYTKVGNRVTFNVTVNLSNKGTIAGYLKITGLPYANGVGQNGISTTKASNVVMGDYFKAWAPVYGSSAFMYLFMVKENVNTGTSQMDTDEITNDTEFEITGSYSV